MTDFLLSERPSKRTFLGSNNTPSYFDEDDEQYFSFSKASADYSTMVGLTNSSSIMPNHQNVSHTLADSKDGSVMDSSASSANSPSNNHHSMANIDDVKINTSNNNNKGTGANQADVLPNVNCKAEPSSKETTELNV